MHACRLKLDTANDLSFYGAHPRACEDQQFSLEQLLEHRTPLHCMQISLGLCSMLMTLSGGKSHSCTDRLYLLTVLYWT